MSLESEGDLGALKPLGNLSSCPKTSRNSLNIPTRDFRELFFKVVSLLSTTFACRFNSVSGLSPTSLKPIKYQIMKKMTVLFYFLMGICCMNAQNVQCLGKWSVES